MALLATSRGMLAGSGGHVIFNTSASFARPVLTGGALGGTTTAPAAVYATAIPGALQPATPREVEDFKKRDLVVTHRFFTAPYGNFDPAAVNQNELLTVAGVVYRVVHSFDMGGRGRYYRIWCEQRG